MRNPLKDSEPLGTWKQYLNATEWFKDKYSYVKVWKIGLPSAERKRRGIEAYGFSGRIGRTGKTTKKYFKSKPQALAHAKSYMRTH